MPHPPTRILNAMSEASVSVDPFLPPEEQVKDIIDLLRPHLPLSIENTEITIKIPPEYATKSYGIVKNLSDIKREEWQADGSWIAIVEIPASMKGEFLERLGKATQGNIQVKT